MIHFGGLNDIVMKKILYSIISLFIGLSISLLREFILYRVHTPSDLTCNSGMCVGFTCYYDGCLYDFHLWGFVLNSFIIALGFFVIFLLFGYLKNNTARKN